MKIALLTDGVFPYVIGGMQKHSYYVAKYLAKNEIYVDLYHTWQDKKYDIHKLEFFTDNEKKYITSHVIEFPSAGNLPGHYLRESYEYSRRIFNVLKHHLDVDFIYTKGFSGWKLLEEKRKGLKMPPVGVKFHGLNMFQRLPSFKSKLEAIMLRPPVMFNIKNADYVFSYGGKISDITRQIGVPENKIIEIPTGIDPEWLAEPQFGNENSVRKFIFIGRYERLKGVEELSDAIKQLLDKYSFEFHFVGPMPEKVQLKHPNVIYHGTINDVEKIKSLLDASDCLLCPSYSEGMPNVIIEAMSRGITIIATDVGAVNCLVSVKNGWLLDTCSVEGIKQALIELITIDKAKLTSMKQESYRYTEQNLIWDKIAEKLIATLKSKLIQ